ncbi:RNA-guided endonuclease InsQ/TnpB family protein [Actinoplanes sp. CA-131856]
MKAVIDQRTAERSYGIAVGIRHLVALSTGELVANPRHLAGSLARLRSLSRTMARRQGPDRRTSQRPSNRWQRARSRLSRAHARVANLRRDSLHKRGRLLVADRWYPSSKTCSACGAVKSKLALSVREYMCEQCGLILDRDLNAARNLAALAAEYRTAGSGPVAGRGADRKTHLGGLVAVKRQPGTASVGQTGTAPPQGGATDFAFSRAH